MSSHMYQVIKAIRKMDSKVLIYYGENTDPYLVHLWLFSPTSNENPLHYQETLKMGETVTLLMTTIIGSW